MLPMYFDADNSHEIAVQTDGILTTPSNWLGSSVRIDATGTKLGAIEFREQSGPENGAISLAEALAAVAAHYDDDSNPHVFDSFSFSVMGAGDQTATTVTI